MDYLDPEVWEIIGLLNNHEDGKEDGVYVQSTHVDFCTPAGFKGRGSQGVINGEPKYHRIIIKRK